MSNINKFNKIPPVPIKQQQEKDKKDMTPVQQSPSFFGAKDKTPNQPNGDEGSFSAIGSNTTNDIAPRAAQKVADFSHFIDELIKLADKKSTIAQQKESCEKIAGGNTGIASQLYDMFSEYVNRH